MPFVCQSYILVCHTYVIRMSLLCACILSICTRMLFVCHSYVLVCHLYVTCMYSHVMVCHSFVLVCHLCFTHIYSYLIRMSLVCTRMLFVCHSYVPVCHPYVTRMYSYAICMSLVCTRMSSLLTRMWFYHEPFTKEETNTLSETLKKPKIINNKKYKLNNKTTEPPKKENKVECIVKYLKKKTVLEIFSPRPL